MVLDMETKTCSKCKVEQNIREFYRSKTLKSGYYSNCKSCIKKYLTDNKSQIRQKAQQYYQKNKQTIKKKRKKYYKNNSEKVSKQVQRWKKNHPWYNSFHCAKQRCNWKSARYYKNYGGRGIKMLMTLKDFEFLWFRDKAYLMERPSIDRKDNDGNYILKNCRFIEMVENSKRKEQK